jgi:hypothetical protein
MMPQPSHQAVHALLLECLSEELVRQREIATLLDVDRSTVSRFTSGSLGLSPAKLTTVGVFLRERRATGRLEPTTQERRARVAESILRGIAPTVLPDARALEALAGLGEPTVALVRRALLVRAVWQCRGNMAAAGKSLSTTHKRIAHAFATLERSQDQVLTPDMAPADPRTRGEKRRRQRAAGVLLRKLPGTVQALARKMADALPTGRGSKLVLAEDVLRAHAFRKSEGSMKAAARLLGEKESIFAYRWQRIERSVATTAREGGAMEIARREAHVSPLHAKLVALATEFGFGILAAARQASLAEVLGSELT